MVVAIVLDVQARNTAHMKLIQQLFGTSLGKKFVMAATGLAMFLFVIVHMLGNLQVFLGAEALNRYAAFLKSVPELLWFARLGLLAMVVLHIYCAVKLALENRAARPVPYAAPMPYQTSYAARTMVWSGFIVFAFIVYHLLHFTLGVVDPTLLELTDNAGRHDVHKMVLMGFSNPWVSGFYVLAMGMLCMHLSHGVSSFLQSLGLRNQDWKPWIDRLAVGSALVVFIGNSSIPLAILMGYGR